MEEEKDLLKEQVMSPVGADEDGNISRLEQAEDVDEIVELFNKDVEEEMSPKYQEELANLAAEDPSQVMIETPKGWVTLAEALRDGYNLESGEYDGETAEQRVERIIKEEGLDEDEANRLRQMILYQEEGAPEEEPVLEEELQEEELPEEPAAAEATADATEDPSIEQLLGGM